MIILIGLRGSGKTTIGRALAARLGAPFTDLDDLTVAALGAANVADAWRARGEAGFRGAEKDALAEALGSRRGVLALGGGTPMISGAAEALEAAKRGGARVVYLRAGAATLRGRLVGKVADRPSLTGADPLAEVEAVLAKRDPVYLQIADLVVNTDAMGMEQTMEAVAGLITP